MTTRLGVGAASLHSPLSKAMNIFAKDKKISAGRETYRQAPRGTNFESIPEIPKVNYEPFTVKKNTVRSILIVIIIVLAVILLGFIVKRFIRGENIDLSSYYHTEGGRNDFIKDVPSKKCPLCQNYVCTCGLKGGVNERFRTSMKGGNEDLYDDDLSMEVQSYAARNNLLI